MDNIEVYKGKSKCSCGRRAKYRVIKSGGNLFACEEHMHRLRGIEPDRDSNHLTEADYQTWMKL